MNADQLRAGRTLLRWSQADLSQRSAIGTTTIKRLEAMDGELVGNTSTLRAIERAMIDGGLIFLDPGDTTVGGYGVRLRDSP